MVDTDPAHVTDLGHANRDETDVIMAKIRDMSQQAALPGGITPGRAGDQSKMGSR